MKTQSHISLSTTDGTPSCLRLSEETQELLRCPVCSSQLELGEAQLKCTSDRCQACFPIVNGIPVLINDRASVFAIGDYLEVDNTMLKPKPLLERKLINLIPSIHAASGFYFLGMKSDRTLSDRELLTQYKGAQASSF